MPGFGRPVAIDLRLQLLNLQRLLCLEALSNLDGAEVLQEGTVDEGVGIPSNGREHEIAPPKLLDQRAGCTVRPQVGHALKAFGQGALEGVLVDQITGQAALAGLHGARDAQEQAALVLIVDRSFRQLGVGRQGDIDFPLVKEKPGALLVQLGPIAREILRSVQDRHHRE